MFQKSNAILNNSLFDKNICSVNSAGDQNPSKMPANMFIEKPVTLHVFFYKHIKIQGLGSNMLKAKQNIG